MNKWDLLISSEQMFDYTTSILSMEIKIIGSDFPHYVEIYDCLNRQLYMEAP